MRTPLALLAVILPPTSLPAAGPVDYLRDIKPILQSRCYACHGVLKQKAGLRLDTAELIRRGGRSGPALEPGKGSESLLIDKIEGAAGRRMPPEGAPLSAVEIGRLRAWIDAGAQAPAEVPQRDPREHWAFRPPERPVIPKVKNAPWVRNPLDAFLAAEHEKRGLTPRPQAEKAELLRRVSLDLTGLAPTRGELHAFLADPTADAYERVVDRLLASPHYGERWGRHWMDVWRYSDWAGFAAEVRESQPHIWRWRDWIIESLNADKGYDRMLVEMLAGDELAPSDPKTLRATGYLARNWYKFNRNVWLQNTVDHTAKAFLGITLSCARCHDHKYDPFAQRDYYRFRAFFEPHDVRIERVGGQPDLTRDGLVRAFDSTLDAKTYLFVRGDEKEPDTAHPLAAGLPKVLGERIAIEPVRLPPEVFEPGSRPEIQAEALARAEAEAAQAAAALAQSRGALETANAPVGTLSGQPPKPAPASRVLADDFAKPRPALWQTGAGRWEYRAGRLLQLQEGDRECRLLSVAAHPRDFRALFRFKITGGRQWRSVGLSFDVAANEDCSSVYLSKFSGDPKLQIFLKQASQPLYPAEGRKPLPVALNREYLLEVDVRDQEVNVSLDGTPVLAYRLPQPRRAGGRLALWAFDATAEFLHVEVAGLPFTLAEARAVLSRAAADVAQAELRLAAARMELEATKARVAAERARHANPRDPKKAETLALAAGRAERRAAVAKQEENVGRAERELTAFRAVYKPGAPKANAAVAMSELKLNLARVSLAEARKAAAQASATYTPLAPVYPALSSGRRLALARWIASRRNPLAARVAVNHIWMRHFGKPLVPTVFDFGLNGKPPSHPALLDWLAVELMDGGWSMKKLHRSIVTSAAYRMQSASPPNDPNRTVDPENTYLWRMNPRRMEAELVRDNVLQVAGQLDTSMGGPELDQNSGLVSKRRSVYFRHAPEKQMTFLKLFDAANVNACYRRDESVVPQQALALINSSLALEEARLLARGLSGELGPPAAAGADAGFVTAAFEQVLGRAPKGAERAACEDYLAAQARRLAGSSKLTAFADGPAAAVAPASEPHLRARENLVHVLINHNDFVTIR